jgi:hypothetical protein
MDVAVSGNFVYVADGSAGLQVIDVSNPTNCVRVGGYDTGGDAMDVALSGNLAYVADGFAGLQVFDVRNPTNCVRVGGYDTSGYAVGVAVSGHYAYVADGQRLTSSNVVGSLQIIDVSNPTNCMRVGSCDTSGRQAVGVAVSGRYAYVAADRRWTGSNWVGSFEVIDVSNPTNCTRVGGYDTSEPVGGVERSGKYVFLANSAAGLQVIDVRDPTNCVRVGGYDTAGSANGVAVVAGRVYVADGEAGLVVLPTLPNVQFTLRVDATPGVPFTIEAATDLSAAFPWRPLLTTNVPAMPFDFVDFDVKLSAKPQKYYRVRQP